MSRKTASFGQLLEYISRSDAKTFDPILHNLQSPGNDVKEIEREFKNNSHYCRKRANGVILYHEVLAFSGKDRQRISAAILNDLACKYLDTRAPGALAYGVIHYGHENPHVHLMISGNLMESSQKLRMSKKDFHRVKKELEGYQLQQYPQLENSVVFQERSQEKSRQTLREQERDRRIKTEKKNLSSQKEALKEKVVYCLLAHTQAEFSGRLHVCDLDIYVRGKTPGIRDLETGRKYRFKTLGLFNQYQETLNRWKEADVRKKEILEMEKERIQKLWKELGFKEQIMELLCHNADMDCVEQQRKRTEELQRIIAEKWRKRRERELEF